MTRYFAKCRYAGVCALPPGRDCDHAQQHGLGEECFEPCIYTLIPEGLGRDCMVMKKETSKPNAVLHKFMPDTHHT